jgi:hypothetical protein
MTNFNRRTLMFGPHLFKFADRIASILVNGFGESLQNAR